MESFVLTTHRAKNLRTFSFFCTEGEREKDNEYENKKNIMCILLGLLLLKAKYAGIFDLLLLPNPKISQWYAFLVSILCKLVFQDG